MTYSVIDVETTGLSPNGGDRVLEIGVVRLDGNGAMIDSLDTLVNPERSVEATHVHGITNEMVVTAPRFRDILPILNDVLDGTVIAAHNASFDMGFLRAEYRRAGTSMPSVRPLCTLVMARRYLSGLPSRSLESCRRHLGLSHTGAHNALADAKAAAHLLYYFLSQHHPEDAADPFQAPPSAYDGPGLFDEPVELKPRSAIGEME